MQGQIECAVRDLKQEVKIAFYHDGTKVESGGRTKIDRGRLVGGRYLDNSNCFQYVIAIHNR